jgi:hypothetical protein
MTIHIISGIVTIRGRERHRMRKDINIHVLATQDLRDSLDLLHLLTVGTRNQIVVTSQKSDALVVLKPLLALTIKQVRELHHAPIVHRHHLSPDAPLTRLIRTVEHLLLPSTATYNHLILVVPLLLTGLPNPNPIAPHLRLYALVHQHLLPALNTTTLLLSAHAFLAPALIPTNLRGRRRIRLGRGLKVLRRVSNLSFISPCRCDVNVISGRKVKWGGVNVREFESGNELEYEEDGTWRRGGGNGGWRDV